MEELKITSMEELKKMSKGEIIELSSFVGSNNINVRVKRLSILGLATNGVIPNQLLGVARKLFYDDDVQKSDLKEYGKVIDIICENTLIEPNIKQLNEINLELTDEQKIELYYYSQRGIEGLKMFRTVIKGDVDTDDKQTVPTKTK